MSSIDELMRTNEGCFQTLSLGGLSPWPARRLAIVACMDGRLALEQALGLKPGDAHIIRNAGGVVTEDVLRSLIISHYLLETREFMIINHTDCGMMTFRDEDLQIKLEQLTRDVPVVPAAFHAFNNLEENVWRQVRKVKSHPWIPKEVAVRGFVFDLITGRLREVIDR